MAASTAFPPARRTPRPASEARTWGVATRPRVACASGQRVAAVTAGILQRPGQPLTRGASLASRSCSQFRAEDGHARQAWLRDVPAITLLEGHESRLQVGLS